jgi:hypothetical protein
MDMQHSDLYVLCKSFFSFFHIVTNGVKSCIWRKLVAFEKSSNRWSLLDKRTKISQREDYMYPMKILLRVVAPYTKFKNRGVPQVDSYKRNCIFTLISIDDARVSHGNQLEN